MPTYHNVAVLNPVQTSEYAVGHCITDLFYQFAFRHFHIVTSHSCPSTVLSVQDMPDLPRRKHGGSAETQAITHVQ